MSERVHKPEGTANLGEARARGGHTHGHAHTLSHTLSLSHTLTLSHTLSHSLSHSHTHSLSLSLSLSLSHTLTHTLPFFLSPPPLFLPVQVAQTLRDLIQPHFLRREKKTALQTAGAATERSAQDDVLASTTTVDEDPASSSSSNACKDGEESKPAKQSLPRKDDLVMWVRLSDLQLRIYRHFLESERVRDILSSTKSPLAALTVMKKLCDHPRLLRGQEQYHAALGLKDSSSSNNDQGSTETDDALACEDSRLHTLQRERSHNMGAGAASDTDDTLGVENLSLNATHMDHEQSVLHEGMSSVLDAETVGAIFRPRLSSHELVKQSGKLDFCIQLLRQLKREGHRVLIFSQSLKMLDMISAVLQHDNTKYVQVSRRQPQCRQGQCM